MTGQVLLKVVTCVLVVVGGPAGEGSDELSVSQQTQEESAAERNLLARRELSHMYCNGSPS